MVVAVPVALLDAVRVPAPSVRRQVPQYWGRIFPPRTVAVLYGARLGVGPLTILPTWLWWAATAIAVSRRPWAGAAAGVAFAVSRVITMWLAGIRARAIDGADRTIRLTFAALALVALAACSGDDDDGDPAGADDATTTISELTLEPRTTTTTTPEDTALAELLLMETLPGFDVVAEAVLDLDDAAALEQDEVAERALLETRGFVRGASRTWSGPNEDVAFVTAYELGSPEQAEVYLIDGAEQLTARGASTFEVPDIDGGFGFTTEEDEFVAHAVAFARDALWFLVLVGSVDGSRAMEEAISLAADQAALVRQRASEERVSEP